MYVLPGLSSNAGKTVTKRFTKYMNAASGKTSLQYKDSQRTRIGGQIQSRIGKGHEESRLATIHVTSGGYNSDKVGGVLQS